MTRPLTIGKVAKVAAVNIETIRYYQRIGLIAEPPRPDTGYRIYPEEVVTRIKFIKRAQQLGFSLEEIAELLQMGDGNCEDIRQQAEQKRELITEQIRDLELLRQTLDTLIDSCNKGSHSCCPIVKALTETAP